MCQKSRYKTQWNVVSDGLRLYCAAPPIPSHYKEMTCLFISRLLSAAALLPAVNVFAGNLVLMDQFNVPACVTSPPANNPGFTNCDVIGVRTDFDLQKAVISFNRSATTINIYQNYRNAAVSAGGFSQFAVGAANIGASDIFFGNGASIVYGIAMSNQNGFQAGSLYAVGGGVTARTAASVLNLPSPPWYYRTTRKVLLGGAAPAQSLGAGSLTASATGGNGTTTGAEFRLNLQLGQTASTALYDAATANGGFLDVYFQSATCGNDILDGRIATPEPSAFMLMGTAVLALGVAARRRRRLDS